ncbi:hypothetical protein B0H17DRAFT_1144844 [Mycena rosella]|uniref:Uncharacterized protein n=1 Tax=Mycena rosella TaxID=1033263 RepID=A0AAD7G6J8_MYCRO|nr:hypothetical protein B0H17DRAFT_1144844 [Mycena rosella]
MNDLKTQLEGSSVTVLKCISDASMLLSSSELMKLQKVSSSSNDSTPGHVSTDSQEVAGAHRLLDLIALVWALCKAKQIVMQNGGTNLRGRDKSYSCNSDVLAHYAESMKKKREAQEWPSPESNGGTSIARIRSVFRCSVDLTSGSLTPEVTGDKTLAPGLIDRPQQSLNPFPPSGSRHCSGINRHIGKARMIKPDRAVTWPITAIALRLGTAWHEN